MNTKKQVQEQFSHIAEKYRDARLFKEGEDLQWMTAAADLKGTERVLDVATAAGHTAIAFAKQAKESIGIDLTQEMIAVAADFARENQMSNVRFEVGDAEKLAFDNACFDLVTCRYATHHFEDLQQSIAEIARVLKPGGSFFLIDHYAPEDSELDEFVNTLDKLRDASHVRERKLSEYAAMFQAAGLDYHELRHWDLPLDVHSWVERAGTPPERRRRLELHITSASEQARRKFLITLDKDGGPESFCLKAVLIQGMKRELLF